jgi:hypothetical protein
MTPEERPTPIELDQPSAPRRVPAPPAPRTWTPEPPPTSWLQDNLTRVVLWGILGAAALGGALWWYRPVTVPDLALKDTAGQTTTLYALRQGRPNLVVVFLLKGDSLSAYSMAALKDLQAQKPGLAFAGLYVGTQGDAEVYQKETEAPFPVYGLTDTRDPFAVQDLLKKVGVTTMVTTGIYGGTVVVLDRHNTLALRLQKEELKELRTKVGKL